ncbi:Aerobic cobaltochelatase subunit CobN [Candidatus Terasakiella magnetica]|uniref:Cobaltochelatase subunit CobN n=1 Tax=Candidatus Terasakiella magnetica TaxID=1867952 RepID=A0A1C3RIJ4_9PROT|nr:cobaltochelatase subunit CobN [Candidatus Terasakiella magnetica]SCA57100.1 Aerobic cobaltochelatase subunit CobN [Candidatus Terasakiella magnetica]
MHLLAATPGAVSDGSEAIDLGQTPADIVVMSAADTELACLALAHKKLHEDDASIPTLRLASLLHMGHNMSVDLYVEDIISHAKLVVLRLLGGRSYLEYGVDEITRVCSEKNIPVAFLPGDDQPDAELANLCSIQGEAAHRLWQYCVHGGVENATEFLNFAHHLLGRDSQWAEPAPLLRAGIYGAQSLAQLKENDWVEGQPVAAITFYRALMQAGNTAVIDGLIEALKKQGLNPLPLYGASLKDEVAASIIEQMLEESNASIILNGTGFALSKPNAARTKTPFDVADCPVLQVVFAGSNLEAWSEGTNGLSARDIAMNVALPEVDGRILSRAVSFKGLAEKDALTQCDIVSYQPVADRLEFSAELAANWAKLRNKAAKSRKIALILANYPNKDGRMGNGVGLDTPAACVNVLKAMAGAGYHVENIPLSGNELIERLQAGVTNDFTKLDERDVIESLSLEDYQRFFLSLPQAVQDAVNERWGSPAKDPFYKEGSFVLPAYQCGNVAVCLQPARGYNIDPVESYHSPDLVPPHNYLAFYAWVRKSFIADAVIHMGKHGNLEWLPGKAIALSENCYPEAIFGPLVHLYPFIINDPGEGTQAKRRSQAVIIDHLTPPLTRAESYGPLKDLEQLVDEYYEAAGVDPRRLKVLKKEILALSRTTGLDEDCGIGRDDGEEEALAKLDNHLCELKELQIRDGLHIFGESPEDRQLNDLLVALVRVPRNKGEGADASIIRAMAEDFDLNFDPLDCDMAGLWEGLKPELLQGGEEAWRTNGDTVERLEILAAKFISNDIDVPDYMERTKAVLSYVNGTVRPAVLSCGDEEIKAILTGLDGRFVEPGASGAPTRGRPEILPTGKNFYSVDTRTVPTPAAWTLGWKSASLMIERYMQDHGDWPRTMALTAWGTSNMRTGGDDIAQGLALMGVQPTWDSVSRRITGFDIMPQSVLGRPRVDVTLRVSGFFRDAFPSLIDLFDSAARAVAALDEGDDINPLAARVRQEKHQMMSNGASEEEADMRAGFRVFGSKPGAYGAGLQALIDEKGWETADDLAKAYVAWGGYAYGSGAGGQTAHGLFEERLSMVEAVVQNQDNREHDLLDSDDYYQFEGGMSAAIRSLKGGEAPTVYHNDHSRPESPRIRTLEEEIARVVRARVVNPKWIEGVKRHGYKGAFEMAATLDYMFAFSATANCVKNHHFDAVFEAYVMDEENYQFLKDNNPAALKEMLERFQEAQDRNMWNPRSNSARFMIEEMLEGL